MSRAIRNYNKPFSHELSYLQMDVHSSFLQQIQSGPLYAAESQTVDVNFLVPMPPSQGRL